MHGTMHNLLTERAECRSRPKGRGRPKRAFMDDPDRFALAMIAWVLAENDLTTYQAAWFAAAVLSPGKGRAIEWDAIREPDGRISSSPRMAFSLHNDVADRAHSERAKLLKSKYDGAAGFAKAWIALSGHYLRMLVNSRRSPFRQRYALTLLQHLGWTELPRPTLNKLRKAFPNY